MDSEKNTIVEVDGFGKHEDYCENDATQICEPKVCTLGLTFFYYIFVENYTSNIVFILGKW